MLEKQLVLTRRRWIAVHFSSDEFLVGDRIGSLYAGKLAPDLPSSVRDLGDRWVFLAARMFAPDGAFVGELSDPLPAAVDGEGNLSVDWHP